MITHKISKGFDLPLAGAAERTLVDAPASSRVAVEPPEFSGIKAKVLVKEGERVRTGDPLFFDKRQPDTRWLSPGTGTVAAVVLGPRRVVERIEIELEARDEYAPIPHVAAEAIASVGRPELVAALRGAGLWPLIGQRPVGRIADPDKVPVAVFVNAMDTEPNAADPLFALQGHGEDLQAGIDALRRLSDGPLYVTVRAGQDLPKEVQSLQGVELHAFAGPHPAGLVGTHIHEIRPLKASEVVYCLRAQHAALIGRWIRSGQYPHERVVAVAGSAVGTRRYYRMRQGAALETILEGLGDDPRIIRGTVLGGPVAKSASGAAAGAGKLGFLGYRDTTVTVIPDGEDQRDLFGWALPQPNKLTMHAAVNPWRKQADIVADARLHGGPRAIVNIGSWEAVMPLDIYPTFLVRAIQANDLEEAMKLGLLEVTEEDVALCTVVDPCKTDVGAIIRQGLDLYEREG